MENGIVGSNDDKLGEAIAVQNEILDQNMKENVDLNLAGSKDSEGDEVSEEAVEAETETVGSENSTLTKDEDVELSGTLENDTNSVNSGLFHEPHKFEEVIVAPGPENYPEEQIEIDRILIDEKHEATDDGVADKNDGAVEDEKCDDSESGETENPNDRYEELGDLNRDGNIPIKRKSFLEVLTSGDTKISDADNTEKLINETESEDADKEKLDIEAFFHGIDLETFLHKLTETQDGNMLEARDISSDVHENSSVDHVNSSNASNHEVAKSVVTGSDALKRHIHDTSHEFENKNERNQQGKRENFSADPHYELKEDRVDQSEEKSLIDDANHTELEKSDSESGQVVEDDSQDVDQEENVGCVEASDPSPNNANESSELGTNLHPFFDDSTSNPEKSEVERSSELIAENTRPLQSVLVEPITEVSTDITRSREQEVLENGKKKISLSEIKEQEIGPVIGISETSDLNHAVMKTEPVSRDTSANGKQEAKSASKISSANSVTVPPEPASQIEQGRKSTPDIPSISVTSPVSARPAGLGLSAPLPEPTSRVAQHPRVNGAIPTPQKPLIEDPTNVDIEEYDETREKLQMIRVKFLRLAHRLGQTPHNVVVAQVLYRLGLAEQLHGRGGRVAAFSFDRASAMAENLEASVQEPLDFTCTIMVIGKSGVGKSSTINSIFDKVMFGTDAFQSGTKNVQDIVGTVQGIRVRVIDTPGLLPSSSDQRQNEKTLLQVKRFIKKTPPDIVLYLDRMDMQCRDFGDMPLLRSITDIFGPSIWFNAIVVLTHAGSAPPEGPNGVPTSYDMFVTQRSHVVQQAIRQAAGDTRLMNPVSLVENHSACRTNRDGQRVLPNGQIWKPHLLLLSFASKILAEANTLLKLQDSPPGRPFAPRMRPLSFPFLLSSFLQPRPDVKLPAAQFGGDDDDVMDDDLDECSDSEEESEYDELPPFKSLTKAHVDKLTKAERKAYYDELEYREKLFMKKQLKEEKKRRKLMKKIREAAKNSPLPVVYDDNNREETSGASSVTVPMPDLALPASFDSDNPTHRYRFLDSSNPWLVRAVLELNGWDHDIGYDGINVERLFAFQEKIPISFSGHISKDKKDANIQMEVASTLNHGKGKATCLGFDVQPVGKDYAYTLRSETRFSNHRVNQATAGLTATVLGDVVTAGVKLEDKLKIGKRGQLVVSGGGIYGHGEVAYGGSLEATLRDKDHPLGRFLTTLGISVMDLHGDLAVGLNSQTQIPIGRYTNLIGRLNFNNRGSGQFNVKINSSEQLQIVLIGLIPLVKKLSGYFQPAQYGY